MKEFSIYNLQFTIFKHCKLKILNLLFPRRCFGCRKEGEWICKDCQKSIRPGWRQEGGVTSLFSFHDLLVREGLHHLKYNGIREAAAELVDLAREYYPELTLSGTLLPVPTSKARLRQRGYNQAEVIAQEFARWFRLPVEQRLTRVSQRKSQVGKNREERLALAKHSFAWVGANLAGPIILIDDLCTTGSTLAACREIVQSHTDTPVQALVLAREE